MNGPPASPERRVYRSRGRRTRRALGLVALATTLAFAAAGAWASSRGDAGRGVETAVKIPTPRSDETVRIAVVGDTIMGTTDYGLPADGGAGMFDAVAPLLDADVVIGNLEGALTDRAGSKCAGAAAGRCFAFRTPPSYARWLAEAGFTVMNLANNHANDYGQGGYGDTVAALAKAGVAHTGEPDRITIEVVRGVRVAVIGFSTYPWSNRLDDLSAVRRAVDEADRRADIVVVTMHAGAEGIGAAHVGPGTETYLGENRGNVTAFAETVVAAGADLVVGHGPHVLRGMEFRSGRLVAYSMGNFAGYRALGQGGALSETGVVSVELGVDGRFVNGRLRPVRLVDGGIPAPGGDAVKIVRELSRADFGTRAARIDARGRISTP